MKVTRKVINEEFANRGDGGYKGDNVFDGLVILKKYVGTSTDGSPKSVIEWAGEETVVSINVDKAIDAGITIEDIKELARLDWFIDEEQDDSFACFV